MLFEDQISPETGSMRRKDMAASIALHFALLLFFVLNPDFLSTTPRRVVLVEGEDYDQDRFEVVDLYVPPDLIAPEPLPELPGPEAEAVPPPPPPEPVPDATVEAPEPTPPPEVPPVPPPPVIGPDDVIAEGARPDAPPAPAEATETAEILPPVGGEEGGDGGDGANGGGGPPDEASPEPETPTVEPPRELAENTNPNALVVPSIRRQAENLIDERVALNSRTGSGTGADTGDGEVMPNLTTDQPEILSDTRGYDFGPYMNQVINRVRTNWYALIPEAARIGTLRGRVVIVFTITAPGRIENLRAVVPSGANPLDRAAVAAIQASSPFPELPADFSGDQLVLQFTFLYNMEPE